MAAAEIVRACLESSSEDAWKAFVERFQPLIAVSIARVARRYGAATPALIDDLCQETYLRLCRNNCQALRTFDSAHEDAIFGYIKVIASSVAMDHFRAQFATKRAAEIPDDGTAAAATSHFSIEQSALIQELDRRLSEKESSRDRSIFWLYYRQGYTTKEIAALPHLGLTQKGVESCIFRLTQSLRSIVATQKIGDEKGKSPLNTFGVSK